MQHDERVERIRTMMAEVEGDPLRYRTLSGGERVIVALALSRLDWLRAEGVDNLVQARDRIGLEWSRAVSSATWKDKAFKRRGLDRAPR